MNPKVDSIISKEKHWQKEFEILRAIALDCGLSEELKWGCPCYLFEDRNIVLVHGFKDYCAYLFFKGALLNDSNNILIQQTKNVQAARQIRFNNFDEITEKETVLKTYIYEAIEVEKAGLKVALKKTKEYAVPEEFQNRLIKDKALKKAFEALTPGRQRSWLLHFSQPKQAKTREARIENSIELILNGKGFNERQ